MTQRWDQLTEALDVVPGPVWWLVAALLPLLVGVGMVVADRAGPERGLAIRGSRAIAIGTATLAGLGVIGALITQASLDLEWIPALGVSLDLAADGISSPLLLLTALVGLVAVSLPFRLRVDHSERSTGTRSTGPRSTGPQQTSRDSAAAAAHTTVLPLWAAGHAVEQQAAEQHEVEQGDATAALPVSPRGISLPGVGTYYGALLVVVAAAILGFATGDAIVFFIAFELVLLPMWWLVRRFGDPEPEADRAGASTRFLLVTATGSTLMLVGILALATRLGSTDLDRWADLAASGWTGSGQWAIAALLLVGLGIKIPLWPLHTWLPWVHATAPTAASVLLSAVLLKLGVYGVIRLVVAPLPEGFATLAPIVAGAAVLGILWAGLACLAERDLKRIIAWASIGHLGFIMLAVASGTETGLQAAIIGCVAHGLISALLFVVVGHLKSSWGSADLGMVRAALREVAPRYGVALVLGMAASMGLPGLAGFWGEFGAIYSAWSPAADRTEGWFRAFAVVAAVGAVLAVGYAVRVLREVWAGDRVTPRIDDARGTTVAIVAVLMAAIVALGVYPNAVLTISEDSVQQLVGSQAQR